MPSPVRKKVSDFNSFTINVHWCQDSTVFLKTSIFTLSVKPDSFSQYRKNLSFKTKKMKREVNYIFLLNHWQKHALFFSFGSLWVIRLCFLVKKDRFFLCKNKIIFSFKCWVVHYQIPPLLLQFLKNSKNIWYRLFKKIIWYIINDFTFFLGCLIDFYLFNLISFTLYFYFFFKSNKNP